MENLEKRLSIIEEKLGIGKEENQFEKKEGKWYKASYKSKYLVYAEKLDGNDVLKGYGFCDSGNWHVFTGSYASVLKTVEATNEEVVEALIEEAKRRGFLTIGNKFKSCFSDNDQIRKIDHYINWDGSKNIISLSHSSLGLFYLDGIETEKGLCSNPTIFRGGKWATVIEQDKFAEPKQPTLEQDIQQLKDKYKQYKFIITIEDNI